MTRHCVPHPSTPPNKADRITIAATAIAPPQVLEPHRRVLFTQRLAVLIHRIRTTTLALTAGEVGDER